MPPKPWPREAYGHVIHKLHDRDGNFEQRWFVSSFSSPGTFWMVAYTKDGSQPAYFRCSCPAGLQGHRRVGTAWEAPCRHVRAVSAAETDDGYSPRPSAPVNISALVD